MIELEGKVLSHEDEMRLKMTAIKAHKMINDSVKNIEEVMIVVSIISTVLEEMTGNKVMAQSYSDNEKLGDA